MRDGGRFDASIGRRKGGSSSGWRRSGGTYRGEDLGVGAVGLERVEQVVDALVHVRDDAPSVQRLPRARELADAQHLQQLHDGALARAIGACAWVSERACL